MKWCLVGLGVVLGGLAIASNWNVTRVRGYAHTIKTTPQSIRVADLSAKGPGDNPFVTLTDFRFRPSDVYVSVWQGNQQKMAGGAYFPLDPVRKGKTKPGESVEKTPTVVVISSADSPAEVKAFLNRTTITGLVKGSAFETWDVKKEPVEWRVEGRQPEMVWFVWADTKPEKLDLDRTEKLSYGLGLAALVCMAIGALGFARSSESR